MVQVPKRKDLLEQEENMKECVYNIETTIIGEQDGSKTYEVRKKYDFEGRTSVVIALYPTVSLLNPYMMDNSTLFLLNHARELGYNYIRILNIYPNVFSRKPLSKQLRHSSENMEYIKSVLNSEKEKETDIIIAWGTSLKTNDTTNEIKAEIIRMISQIGLEQNLKHFIGIGLDREERLTPHMLWLGLHCKGSWFVENITVKELAESIGKEIVEQEKVKKTRTKSRTKVIK